MNRDEKDRFEKIQFRKKFAKKYGFWIFITCLISVIWGYSDFGFSFKGILIAPLLAGFVATFIFLSHETYLSSHKSS